jgi:hypothetical protein
MASRLQTEAANGICSTEVGRKASRDVESACAPVESYQQPTNQTKQETAEASREGSAILSSHQIHEFKEPALGSVGLVQETQPDSRRHLGKTATSNNAGSRVRLGEGRLQMKAERIV